MSPPPHPIDLARLDESLLSLLRDYKDALKYVERLPNRLFGFGLVDTEPNWQGKLVNVRRTLFKMNPARYWNGVVSRRLVRFFVESHIRGKVKHIRKHLALENLALQSHDSERRDTLEAYLSEVDRIGDYIAGGVISRTINSLWLWVVIPLFPAVLSPTVTFFLGGNRDTLLTILIWLVFIFVAVVLYGWLIAYPLVSQAGFRWKRIIFLGGQELEYRRGREHVRRQWEQFGRSNVYQAENEVFEVFGVEKPKEFPFGVWFNPLVFSPLAFAVGQTASVIIELSLYRQPYSREEIILFPVWLIFVWILVIWMFKSFHRNRSQQVHQGNV